METVALRPLFHRNIDCIGIYFSMNRELQSLIQKSGAKWSRTKVCWYVPLHQKEYEKLVVALKDKAVLETSALNEYLEQKTDQYAVPAPRDATFIRRADARNRPNRNAERMLELSVENARALNHYMQQLTLKGYSPSTIKTYVNEFTQFLKILHSTPAELMTPDRLKDYLEYCSKTLRLSESTLHSRINALKFYYEQILCREKFFWHIPRPRKPLQLPKVISKEQIASLINAVENKKHKTIITLAYACGLRVSEVISLKVRNVDGKRKLLLVERSKGKKDRVVSLSPAMLIMLREYYREYKPKDYLFEGQHENEHLTARSIQLVLQKAKRKAGIKQQGSMHMLRHSFATHLLDKGIDVVFIQKLLGHNDIKTTLKYLHVTNKDLIHILSPLDDIEGLLKK